MLVTIQNTPFTKISVISFAGLHTNFTFGKLCIQKNLLFKFDLSTISSYPKYENSLLYNYLFIFFA